MPFFDFLKNIFYSFIILIGYIIVFFYIILEEVVWEKFAKGILQYIEYLKFFETIENFLNKANRYIVIFIFLILLVAGELLGILSPIILVKGFFIASVIFYILKLLLIALALWIFNKESQKLLSFKWLEFLYRKIIYLISLIKNSTIYKKNIIFIKKLKTNLKYVFRYIINRIRNFLKI